MLYLLWDLGLKVGHATRTVDESLRYGERDQTIRTALLEARYVWGDRELFDELIKGFAQKFLTGDGRDFVEAKLAERDQRHQRMGDSRYVVEPNVKEGKGGLRDLHLLFWIAEYLYRVHEPSELVAKGVLTGPDQERAGLWAVDGKLTFQRPGRIPDVVLDGFAGGGAGRQPDRQAGARERVGTEQLELAAELAVVDHHGLAFGYGRGRSRNAAGPGAIAPGPG